MTTIGIDFDNTIVHYDDIFYKTALKKKIIEESIPRDKTSIKNYLKSIGKEMEFTNLQAEVYGEAIKHANPADGVLDALSRLKNKKIELYIISHKTRYPYKGPRYNLREAAMKWLIDNKFIDEKTTGIKKTDVFFEPTKALKIERIVSLGCDTYIDDLPEILQMLPKTMKKIHYNPTGMYNTGKLQNMPSWDKLEEIIED